MDSQDRTLPLRLVVTGAYIVLGQGGETIPVVLHNMMGFPIHLKKGQKVAQVHACNEVLCLQLKLGVLEYLKELKGPRPTLSVAECQEKLIARPDL